MRNYKFYTVLFLLFTLSTLASCVNNPKKTTTADKPTQEIQKTTSIRKVDTKTFKSEIEGKKIQLVDVRTPKEYVQGHIENSENINVFDNNFMAQMAKYKKDQPVYVYCRSGGRSMKAAGKLKAAGYNVVNLNGGFMGWEKNGYKSVK